MVCGYDGAKKKVGWCDEPDDEPQTVSGMGIMAGVVCGHDGAEKEACRSVASNEAQETVASLGAVAVVL